MPKKLSLEEKKEGNSMTKLDEFVQHNLSDYAKIGSFRTKAQAEFWLKAFVREVRGRADNTRSDFPVTASYREIGIAFNEIVSELLEEPKP